MSFQSLLRQQRLIDIENKEVEDFLVVKPAKKMLQFHIIEKTGKIVRIKDIHNINTKVNASVDGSLLCFGHHIQGKEKHK